MPDTRRPAFTDNEKPEKGQRRHVMDTRTANDLARTLSRAQDLLRQRLWEREGARRVVANTFWLVLDKIVRLGVGFFVGVWVARYLGPERFGTLNYAAAWVGLFGVFATLGMDGIVVRDVVKAPEERGAVLGTTFLLRTAGCFFLILVSIMVTAVADRGVVERQKIVLIIALSQLFRPFDTIDLWFQSLVKWKSVFVARNVAFLASTALRVALVLGSSSTTGFAWAMVSDTGFAAIGLIVSSRVSKDKSGPWKVDLGIAKRLLRDSWPLALSSIAVIIYMRIDQVMIGKILGDVQVGVYSAAVRISEVWYFIPSAVAQSVFPALVDAKRTNEKVYWRRVSQSCTVLVWLGVIVAVFFQILGTWIIRVLFGSEFAAAAPILRVHTWAGIFVALGLACGNWYTLENRQRLSLISTGVSAAANVVLNFFLIPAVGPMGAALATVVSQIMSAFLVPIVVADARPLLWSMLKSFIPIPPLWVRSKAE